METKKIMLLVFIAGLVTGGIGAYVPMEIAASEKAYSNQKIVDNLQERIKSMGREIEQISMRMPSSKGIASRADDLNSRRAKGKLWKAAWMICGQAQANELSKYGNIRGHQQAEQLMRASAHGLREEAGFAIYQAAVDEEVKVAADPSRPYKNARLDDCINAYGAASD